MSSLADAAEILETPKPYNTKSIIIAFFPRLIKKMEPSKILESNNPTNIGIRYEKVPETNFQKVPQRRPLTFDALLILKKGYFLLFHKKEYFSTKSANMTRASIDFATAMYLNNEGVDALCNGHRYAAINFMKESIKMIKKELSLPPVNNLNESLSEESFTFLKAAMNVQIVEIPCVCLSSEGGSTAAIFKQAMKLPPFLPTFLDDQSIGLMAAVVIFNLALAHQVQHPRSTTFLDQKISLSKAESLYEMVIELVENEGVFTPQK